LLVFFQLGRNGFGPFGETVHGREVHAGVVFIDFGCGEQGWPFARIAGGAFEAVAGIGVVARVQIHRVRLQNRAQAGERGGNVGAGVCSVLRLFCARRYFAGRSI
jgi:hypothetical protein